jgi:hypothetical protein
MKNPTNSWAIKSFLKWWETKQERFHCGQFNEKEIAYSAWLAGIDYYIDNIEEKLLPYYLSPTEEAASLSRLASMDDLYDDNDDPMNQI